MAFDLLSFLLGKSTGSGGGGGSAALGPKTIRQNGVYRASSDNLDGYNTVTVEVPNTYAAADEGKVVSNGALVAQTAHADVTPTTFDQTIDTTLNNSLKLKGDADLVAGNIKKDVEIFGVTGTYEGGSGSAIKSGSFTPASRVAYVDIDIGLSDPNFIVIVPHSETPLKSGGKTFIGGWYSKNTFYKTFLGTSNNSGSSPLTPVVSNADMLITMTGTTARCYSSGTSSESTLNAGNFETIQYDWFAW